MYKCPKCKGTGEAQELLITRSQQNALHLFLTQLSTALNDMGLDMRKVLKPAFSIPWNTQNAKDFLWRPIQKVLYSKHSTTELSKHEEITEIHKVLMRELGEKHGVEYIEFPSMKEGEVDKEGKIKISNY